jgi:acetyl-CoA carboxylase carboxyltransferase component
MVGPDMEKRAQVRHVCRMFVVGSHLTVPFFTLVLRRGYGLGVMAMSRGGFHEAFFTAAWPTGEFGAMGIDGAIKAGFKKELAAIEDETARNQLYNQLVEELYKRGQAMNMASYLEIDAVIDPAETRRWIIQGVKSAPREAFTKTCRPFVDPW